MNVCSYLSVSEIISPHFEICRPDENFVVGDVDAGDGVLGLLQRLDGLLPLGLCVPAADCAVDGATQRNGRVLVEADAVHCPRVTTILTQGKT